MAIKKITNTSKKTTSGRKKLMANKTISKIPKTATEKKMWIRARQIATKQGGAQSEKEVSWGLVNTIYQNAKKAKKVPKKSDVKKAKYSKTVASYVKKPKRSTTRKK